MVQQGPTRFFIDWGNGEKHLNAWANDGRCLTSDVGHPMSDTFPPRLRNNKIIKTEMIQSVQHPQQ